MLRPSGPVTGNSNEVVNSGMSSFTGTSSGTSAFRVPPDGSTSVTGTSDIFDSFSNLARTDFCKTGLRNAGYKLFGLCRGDPPRCRKHLNDPDGSPLHYI